MTLKEKVFEYIQKSGPKTNAELVEKFKVQAASMRRTCGELAQAGKLVPTPSTVVRVWGIAADAREEVAVEDFATGPKKTGSRSTIPKPTPAAKKEDKPVDPKDWRMTDFCF